MKKTHILSLFLTTFLLLTPITAEARQAIPTSHTSAPSGIYPSCQYGNCPSYSHNNCTMEIIPTQAVIHAGIVVENQKPIIARHKLDTALEKIEHYFKDIEAATLERKGTIRATNGSIRDKSTLEQQYVLGEQLLIRLSPKSNIDEIIENLSQLGINRFGIDWITGSNYSGLRPLVMYTTENLLDSLNTQSENCKVEAWKAWCNTRSGNHIAYCGQPIDKILPYLNITNFYVNGPQIFENRNYTNFNMRHPWDKNRLENIYFRTDDTQAIRGNMNIQLVPFLMGAE